MDVGVVADQLRPPGFGTVVTRALSIEQTHNRAGGVVYPLALIDRLRSLSTDVGAALHCDGARIWNAHAASGVPLADYGARFDTLSVCLSKGLGAPVGSLVVTSADRAAEARGLRKRLGGGMRQAGILAAAGLYAVRNNVERLAEDHTRAMRLAVLLDEHSPSVVEPTKVETNIVLLELTALAVSAHELAERAAAEGVLIGVVSPQRAALGPAPRRRRRRRRARRQGGRRAAQRLTVSRSVRAVAGWCGSPRRSRRGRTRPGPAARRTAQSPDAGGSRR